MEPKQTSRSDDWQVVNRKTTKPRNQIPKKKTTNPDSEKPKIITEKKKPVNDGNKTARKPKKDPQSKPQVKPVEKVEPVKTVYANDGPAWGNNSLSTYYQSTSIRGSVQYKLDRIVPHEEDVYRAFPEIPKTKIPVQVFQNKQQTLIVVFSSSDDGRRGSGEVIVYSSRDLRVLGTMSMSTYGFNYLHWVDFHPTRPLIALTFTYKDDNGGEHLGDYSVHIYDWSKNKCKLVSSRSYYWYDDENDNYEEPENFVFNAMIFTANLTLSELTKGISKLPESDDDDDDQEKLNRKEQRTRDLVNSDSLIFSSSQEISQKGRRRYYGNLRWYKLDLKNIWNSECKQEYYRNIRRPILKCINSEKSNVDQLKKWANERKMVFEPLKTINRIVTMNDPILGSENFYAVTMDTYQSISLWNIKNGKCENSFSLKHNFNKLLLSNDHTKIYVSRPQLTYPINAHVDMSPFATFDTSSFFNNFFVSERISYSETLRYTMEVYSLGILHAVVTNPDTVVQSASGEFYGVGSVRIDKIEGKSVVGGEIVDVGEYITEWLNSDGQSEDLYAILRAKYGEPVKLCCVSMTPSGPQSKIICSLPTEITPYYSNLTLRYKDGAAVALLAIRWGSYVTCYALPSGAEMWTRTCKEFEENPTVVNFPKMESVVLYTNKCFTVLSWSGNVISHAQRVLIDGVFRNISALTVQNESIVIGLTDGRICTYSVDIMSLVQLCARKIVLMKNTRQIDELCKRVPHDIVVRLEEAYYQFK